MATLAAPALIAICCLYVAFGKLGAPGGVQKLQHEPADSFKIMKNFPFAVAMSDSDNDTIFECWAAKRTEIDEQTRTATYVLHFPATGQKIPFHVQALKDPGAFTFYLDDDLTPKEGRFHYTDYNSCVIEELEYHGHQCVLWARRESKDSLPQECIDKFVDTCGVVVPEHSRDLCDDSEEYR
ncbi:uncharacterized protein LOC144097296 [Amblyomma americanum]